MCDHICEEQESRHRNKIKHKNGTSSLPGNRFHNSSVDTWLSMDSKRWATANCSKNFYSYNHPRVKREKWWQTFRSNCRDNHWIPIVLFSVSPQANRTFSNMLFSATWTWYLIHRTPSLQFKPSNLIISHGSWEHCAEIQLIYVIPLKSWPLRKNLSRIVVTAPAITAASWEIGRQCCTEEKCDSAGTIATSYQSSLPQATSCNRYEIKKELSEATRTFPDKIVNT